MRGLVPEDEPSLLEQLFPLADASKLRQLMFQMDVKPVAESVSGSAASTSRNAPAMGQKAHLRKTAR
jgi:hypothetical protein